MAALTRELRDCLPACGPITEYVEWRAPLTHAPPIIHLAAILPLAAYEAARRGYTVPYFDQPHEWFAVVAPPASAKSTQINEARKFATDLYETVSEREAHCPRPWISLEGSIQGVIQRIAEIDPSPAGRTCGILYHTEFAHILRNDEIAAPLCRLYDGEDYDRNYRFLQREAKLGGLNGAQGSRIREVVMSAVTATTPSALERAMRAETLEGGLFSRFFWFRETLAPADLAPMPSFDDRGRQRVLDTWTRWYATLNGLEAQGVHRRIRYTPEAHRFHVEVLFERLRPEMAGEGFTAGVALRTVVHATRLSAIYALSRGSHDGRHVLIELDDLVRASNLAIRSKEQAAQIGSALAAAALPIDGQTARLIEMIRATGATGATRRDVYRLFGNKLHKGQVEALLEAAEDQGYIAPLMGGGSTRATLRYYATEYLAPSSWQGPAAETSEH